MKLVKKHKPRLNRGSLLLSTLFLLVTALNIFSFIKAHNVYKEPFDPEIHRKLYGASQYINKNPLSEIGDEIVYAFAGWEYVHGLNPILLNGEQPPLGKYFIGLSELWFNNSRYTAAVFNVLCLVALFWLLYLLLGSSLVSSALITLFSFEKVFLAQMQYAPLLDNIQVFFILLSFCFFVKWFKNSKSNFSLVASLLSLGLVISTKFWITGFIIFVVWLLSLLLAKNMAKVKSFLCTLPFALFPLIASYYQSFAQGMTLREFFGTQKYIYSWHSAKLEFNPIAVWDFLLIGRWHNQGEIKQAVDWQWTWPLLAILSVFAIYKLVRVYKKHTVLKDPVYIIGVWFVVYFGLLSVSTVNARYLFPILPAMYVLSGWVIKSFVLDKRR